jgi:ribosomal protein S1
LRKAGDPAAAAMELEATPAAKGERPGVAARRNTTVTVTINSVDTKSNVVKFHGDDKLVRELAVHRPEAQAFIKQLKPGDQVVVTYAESLAVSVEPVKPAK